MARTPLVVAALLALGLTSCPGDPGGADSAPLPARILAPAGAPLQPIRLPEVRTEPEQVGDLTPPPGGDPVARAVVLGRAPIEKAVRQRDDGRIQVGRIIVDPAAGTMMVPGQVNQTDGIIEYFAVGPRGKLHESVLMLDVDALQLQIGCILLGLKAAPLRDQDDPNLTLTREGREEADPAAPATAPEDSQVEMTVTWRHEGKLVERHAEDLTWSREGNRSMPRGYWVYTGSGVHRGVFAAEFEQSYVATWPDRSALFNTPIVAGNPYRGDGLGFEANNATLPPKGTPMFLTIRRRTPSAAGTAAAPAAPAAPAPAP